MNEKLVIGNATKDGAMSPNGQWYEVTIADSPPKGSERYVTNYIRCSYYVDETHPAPTIKKGQRCLAVGTEFRRDWKDEAKGKSGTEMEMKCSILRPNGGKLNEYIDETSGVIPAEADGAGDKPKGKPAPKAGAKPKF